MNRIFKVIWSQTRQAYIVVSELVKRGGWVILSSAQKLALGLAVAGMVAAPAGSVEITLSSDKRLVIIKSDDVGYEIQSPLIHVYGLSDDTVVPGDYANAYSEGSIAIGKKAIAGTGGDKPQSNDVAIGYNAQATSLDATALGGNTLASGGYSTALGASAQASGDYSTALGFGAHATGKNSTALGVNAHASNTDSTAVGYGVEAKGHGADR